MALLLLLFLPTATAVLLDDLLQHTVTLDASGKPAEALALVDTLVHPTPGTPPSLRSSPCRLYRPRTTHWLKRPILFGGVLQFFMGRKKTGSRDHCAPARNFFLMLDGQKKWTFIDAAYSPLMSPHHLGGDAVYWRSEAAEQTQVYRDIVDRLSAEDRAALDERMLGPQRERIEAMFRKCPRQEVVLKPGDVLYVPLWVWHEVESLTETTVAAATRWFDPNLWRSPNADLEALLMLRPSPAYHSSLPAFQERVLTLKGALKDSPVPVRRASDVEAGTRSAGYAGMDGLRESVRA